MKTTGIIRRVDDLGRVVIPKDLRRFLNIREGDPLEIYTDILDGIPCVYFCKYQTGFFQKVVVIADHIDDEMMASATNEQRSEVRKHFNEIAKILKEWEKE